MNKHPVWRTENGGENVGMWVWPEVGAGCLRPKPQVPVSNLRSQRQTSVHDHDAKLGHAMICAKGCR